MFPLKIGMIISFLQMAYTKGSRLVAEKSKDYSFYLWGICTAVNTAQIIRSIVSLPGSGLMVVWIWLFRNNIVPLQTKSEGIHKEWCWIRFNVNYAGLIQHLLFYRL